MGCRAVPFSTFEDLFTNFLVSNRRRYKEDKDDKEDDAEDSDENNDVSKYDLSDFTLVDETKGNDPLFLFMIINRNL